jgi:uncharacterized repeat protein (TIGR01451 family)
MKQSFSLMSLIFLCCATFAAADGISLPGPVAGTEEIVAWNSNEALQHTLTYSPLEAQDLTHGGDTDALSLRITETPPGLLPAVIVWSGKDASVWEGTLAWPTFGGDFVIPFDSFVPMEGWGADFTRVTRIEFVDDAAILNGASKGVIVMGATTTIASTKTDALVDIDMDGETNPGDELVYTIILSNTGAADAVDVTFNDTPDANTELITGSVTTSSGSVTQGNGISDAAVTISIPTMGVPPCQSGQVVITFRVRVSDPFPDMVNQVCNQGLTDTMNTPSVFTDDPNVMGFANPTCTTVVVQIEGGLDVFHAADTNEDGKLGLAEILRIIQFYNVNGYSCDPTVMSEDGYLPGDGVETCTPHDSDYSPQDWAINLSELLRNIQFFNVGGYEYCPAEVPPSEDDFCPGAA